MKHCILAKYRPEVYSRRQELLPRIRQIFSAASELEGVSGVAGVTVSGALTREAHVILDQEKMDALSATLEDAVKDQLKKAEGKLRDAEKKVTDGQQALADAKRAAADGVAESVGDAVDKVYDKLKDIYGVLEDTDIDDIVGVCWCHTRCRSTG